MRFMKFAELGAVFVLLSATGSAVAGDTGKGGLACTYNLCMSRCLKLASKFCEADCERLLKERKASGVCK